MRRDEGRPFVDARKGHGAETTTLPSSGGKLYLVPQKRRGPSLRQQERGARRSPCQHGLDVKISKKFRQDEMRESVRNIDPVYGNAVTDRSLQRHVDQIASQRLHETLRTVTAESEHRMTDDGDIDLSRLGDRVAEGGLPGPTRSDLGHRGKVRPQVADRKSVV